MTKDADIRFVEDDDHTHLAVPADGGYTLCGLGLDGDWHDLRDTDRTVVTCPSCAVLLQAMKHVKHCAHDRAVLSTDRDGRKVETCPVCGMYRILMDLGYTDWRREERA